MVTWRVRVVAWGIRVVDSDVGELGVRWVLGLRRLRMIHLGFCRGFGFFCFVWCWVFGVCLFGPVGFI